MRFVQCIQSRLIGDSHAASLIEVALVMPVFLILVFGAVDFGFAYYQAVEVKAAAHAGAMYGLQNPQDTAGMQTAAVAGANNFSDMAATATYGCECSDGTSDVASCTYTPSCTSNYVTYVNVSTTSTYRPVIQFPGMPQQMTFHGKSRIRVGGS